MNRYGSLFKPLMWFMALLLAFVAGCGGDDDAAPPSAAGAVCTTTGAVPCVNLATAGDFVILAQTAISDLPTSAITGNVGLEAGASITGLTCPEVQLGKVIDSDAGYADPACRQTDGSRLTQALIDAGAAFTDAAGRTPTGPTPPGPTFPPGVYNTGGGVTLATDITLDGGATDVWIFQIPGALALTTGNVLLSGGAQPQNVFWRTTGGVSLGVGRQLPGIVMANGTVALGSGATVNGRLYSTTDVTLDADTVARP